MKERCQTSGVLQDRTIELSGYQNALSVQEEKNDPKGDLKISRAPTAITDLSGKAIFSLISKGKAIPSLFSLGQANTTQGLRGKNHAPVGLEIREDEARGLFLGLRNDSGKKH